MDLLIAVRALVALAAVLGLLLFLSRRLQKGHESGASPFAALIPKRLGRMLPGRPVAAKSVRVKPEKIHVIARSGLSGKAQLVVAEFGGIRYVLGVTEHGVSVVDTQEAPLADDESDDSKAAGAAESEPARSGHPLTLVQPTAQTSARHDGTDAEDTEPDDTEVYATRAGRRGYRRASVSR